MLIHLLLQYVGGSFFFRPSSIIPSIPFTLAELNVASQLCVEWSNIHLKIAKPFTCKRITEKNIREKFPSPAKICTFLACRCHENTAKICISFLGERCEHVRHVCEWCKIQSGFTGHGLFLSIYGFPQKHTHKPTQPIKCSIYTSFSHKILFLNLVPHPFPQNGIYILYKIFECILFSFHLFFTFGRASCLSGREMLAARLFCPLMRRMCLSFACMRVLNSHSKPLDGGGGQQRGTRRTKKKKNGMRGRRRRRRRERGGRRRRRARGREGVRREGMESKKSRTRMLNSTTKIYSLPRSELYLYRKRCVMLWYVTQ